MSNLMTKFDAFVAWLEKSWKADEPTIVAGLKEVTQIIIADAPAAAAIANATGNPGVGAGIAAADVVAQHMAVIEDASSSNADKAASLAAIVAVVRPASADKANAIAAAVQ